MSHIPSPLLVLRSSGMVTAVGNSTAQTVASWVAQSRRFRKFRLDGFADPFTIVDCQSITSELFGADRLAALLPSAIIEAIESAPDLSASADAPCLEILIVPPRMGSADCERLSSEMTSWLAPYHGWSDRPRQRLIVSGGATAAWSALEHAYQALLENPHLQHVLIAAVDSACDPTQLTELAKADFLLRPGNSEGIVPGEAAACVLLERVANAAQIPVGSFAIHRPSLVLAGSPFWPSVNASEASALGQTLASALSLAGMEAVHISHLESDMDGSNWRALVEASALNRVIFSETTALPQWRPATLLGQTGAAFGLIGWVLPAVLHDQAIESVNTVLHWSIEPSGECAACVIERSPY